jgi:hypothetical protein
MGCLVVGVGERVGSHKKYRGVFFTGKFHPYPFQFRWWGVWYFLLDTIVVYRLRLKMEP